MAEEQYSGVTGWVVDVVDAIGEVGVGALIALENVFPPIPSEVILPLAGFRAEAGELNIVLAWIAATAGALVGALILYGLGAWFGYDRLDELAGKRWFVFFGQKDLDRGKRFFDRHGDAIVLFGRCVPLVRSIVSVPAGIDRMRLGRFVVLTIVGSGVWNAIFMGAGWALGDRWERVEGWIQPLSYGVVVVLAAAVAWLTRRTVQRRRAARTV
jgi:membrane protein DedA with SNARE-associated domain